MSVLVMRTSGGHWRKVSQRVREWLTQFGSLRAADLSAGKLLHVGFKRRQQGINALLHLGHHPAFLLTVVHRALGIAVRFRRPGSAPIRNTSHHLDLDSELG